MIVLQRTIMQELSNKGLLQGRILIYGGDNDALDHWCTDYFDPLYRPMMPAGKYDVIICSYVLCVLTPDQRRFVLQDILGRLNTGGRVYFTVTPGYHLPFKSILSYNKCTTYCATHQSLTNWNKIYETQAIAERLRSYLDRKDVLWEAWLLPDDPVTAQLTEDFQVKLWHEGGYRPDEEMVTKLRFAHGKSLSFDMIADGQLWRTAYHKSLSRDKGFNDYPFPAWRASAAKLTLADCRELLDAVIKNPSYTRELNWRHCD